jgi:hypothetical protein
MILKFCDDQGRVVHEYRMVMVGPERKVGGDLSEWTALTGEVFTHTGKHRHFLHARLVPVE